MHTADVVFLPVALNPSINGLNFINQVTSPMRGGYNASFFEFAQHILTGTEFDCSERHPPPACQPGTRFEILSQLGDLRKLAPGKGHPVIWLRGPAGVGISAIMQTFAEDLSHSNGLGAALFLSRYSTTTHIIPTLAYQLASRMPEYRTRFLQLIELDPSIPRKSMRHQFSKLIAEPFSCSRSFCDDQIRLVLIDGLDKCGNERAQCELVTLIISFVRDHPELPLRWVISSRPEYHLKREFGRSGLSSTVMLQEVSIGGSEARKDVEKYLDLSFRKIRDDFHGIVPAGWPTSHQSSVIVKASNGFFAFAEDVLRYVREGHGNGDPVHRLESAIAIIDHHPLIKDHDNPFNSLNRLYTHILSDVPTDLIPTLHLILGFYLLYGTTASFPLHLTADILGIPQNNLNHALQRLHSVLDIPSLHEVHEKPLRFLHTSFSDYLRDIDRSKIFWLDMENQHLKVAACYIRKLELILEGQSNTPSSWDHPADNDVRVRAVREVKQNWFRILSEVATKLTSPRCSSELQSLIAAINNLRFNAFDVNDALGFINLVNWISNGSHPLWYQLIFEEIQLESFSLERVDTSRVSVYHRTFPDHWGFSSFSSHPLFPSYREHFEKHWLSMEDFLGDFKTLRKYSRSSNPRVLIIGRDPTKRCAIILTVPPTYEQKTQPVVRYYFPLKF